MIEGLNVEVLFESFVNLEGCKTIVATLDSHTSFESFVNLEGCKTNVR